MDENKQAEPVAKCAWSNEFNGPILCNEGDENNFDGRLYRHPAPSVAQGEADDSLLLCASDLEHSAIYDNHSEMQDCIRAVAQRIKALGQTAPAVAANEVKNEKDS